jgi:hypothetical protein
MRPPRAGILAPGGRSSESGVFPHFLRDMGLRCAEKLYMRAGAHEIARGTRMRLARHILAGNPEV